MSTIFTLNQKTCPCCSGLVIGRSDKIFCSIKCKNIHHNAARSQLNAQFKQTQKIIHRNLVVLEGILGNFHNEMIIDKDTLFRYGFNLHSCTSISKTGKKIIYHLGNFIYSICSGGEVKVKCLNKFTSDHNDLFYNRWEKEFPYENSNINEMFNGRIQLNLLNFERRNKME